MQSDEMYLEVDRPDPIPPTLAPMPDTAPLSPPTAEPTPNLRAVPSARSESSYLDQVSAIEEGAELIVKRMEALDTLRRLALRRTDPTDWVVQGNGTLIMTISAARKIGQVYQVEVGNIRPSGKFGFEPMTEKGKGDSKVYWAWADAYCGITKTVVRDVCAGISSTGDFTGRKVNDQGKPIGAASGEAFVGDVRSSLYSLICKKAIVAACGLGKVTTRELEAAWEGTGKSLSQSTAGHGGGSSAERRTKAEAEDGVKEAAQALHSSIVAAVGGDQEAYTAVVREITAWKGKDGKEGSFDSLSRLGKKFQIENAAKKWAAHPLNGGGQ